jgi:hypothetical protein
MGSMFKGMLTITAVFAVPIFGLVVLGKVLGLAGTAIGAVASSLGPAVAWLTSPAALVCMGVALAAYIMLARGRRTASAETR